MQRITRTLIVSLLSAFCVTGAMAEDQISLYGGAYDISQKDDEATMFGAEYRFDSFYHGLRPIAGGFVTTDSALYGYAGLQWDIFLTDGLVLAPHTAAGLYDDGSGKNLHNTIQFRSGIELGYEWENEMRLSASFSHISNAGLGLDNPGTETLTLNYLFPVGW